MEIPHVAHSIFSHRIALVVPQKTSHLPALIHRMMKREKTKKKRAARRKYIWTVEQLIKMDLGSVTSIRLADLRMETDMGPEGDEKVEQMEVN